MGRYTEETFDPNSEEWDIDDGKRYKIVRHRFRGRKTTLWSKRNLTLGEAQKHCSDPKTRGPGWFDGYTEDRG